ncbi:hypothetical protein OH764_00815 [Burkholderia sp. M6-3]
MTTQYHLCPPFLHYPEEDDFSDVWERFCCKLLNIEHKTTEIYVRNPPEQGVDIFFPTKKVAYQCKSIESGKSGGFNVTKAVESIRAAKAIKPALGWERYVLCVNVAISGKAEATLKAELPDIEILPNSHWVQMCENYPAEVERNFRKLIEIPAPRIQAAIEERFISAFTDEMNRKLDSSQITIILYCNQHDTTYRVSVSADFTCEELLEVFRAFFKLPESKTVETEEIRVSLSHSVVFEGKQVPLSKTLRDAGILAGSVVTYWTTFRWKDLHLEARGDVIQMMTMHRITAPSGVRSKSERSRGALELFKILVRSRFEQVDASLVGNV